MKYLLTGRSVRLTEAQQQSCISNGFHSLRALSFTHNIPLKKLIASYCSPDSHGATHDCYCILNSSDDMRRDKDGNNEMVQFLLTAKNNVTVYQLTDKGLVTVKDHKKPLNMQLLFQKLTAPTEEFKIALVQRKWKHEEYADYYPCTEYGTSYAEERRNALRQVMRLMLQNRLIRLTVVTDRYDKTLQTLFWTAQRTATEIDFTWIPQRGKAERAVWLPMQDFNEFLASYYDLNVRRYETLDEHRNKVVRYTRPRPFIIDNNPVEHTNDEPEEFEERCRQRGEDPEKIVSYDQMVSKAYEGSDDMDEIVSKVRKGLHGVLTPVQLNIDYAPKITPTKQRSRKKGQRTMTMPVCACEPQTDFSITVDPVTGKTSHRASEGSGCDLCKMKGSDFCNQCPYKH